MVFFMQKLRESLFNRNFLSNLECAKKYRGVNQANKYGINWKWDSFIFADQQSSDSPPTLPPVSSPVSSTAATSPSSGRHKEHKSSSANSTGASVVSLFCAYCNESCKSRRELENHMKSHASPSKHKCNICDEMCPSATTLAEHKLTHCKVQKNFNIFVKNALYPSHRRYHRHEP